MTFTTLTYNGAEKSLADWGIATARREVSNQAGDNIAFDMMLAADAADPFPYGAQITVRIGRVSSSVNPANPTLPPIGAAGFSGGVIWFVGYRVDTFRAGSASLEKLAYKFAGPWEFFFERLVFQKLWAMWNGAAQVADWRSQVILGQSVNALIGPNDTVAGTASTNLMSLAQQIKEIAGYVIAQTTAVYGSPQVQFDPLTATIDGANSNLLETPSEHCLIPDFIAGQAVGGKTSAGSGTSAANLKTVLRAPLESANDITCAEAMRYMLRWIGAVGSPVVWFDYTQTPPMLNVSTRDQLPAVSLPFVGQTADFKIKRRDDLVPAAVVLKFRITSTSNGQQVVQVINDICTTISGTQVEGIGLAGLLQTPGHLIAGDSTYIASGTQTTLQNAARTFAASCATIDMQGGQSITAAIACVSVDVRDPSTYSTAATFWTALFPELSDVTNLTLYDATGAPAIVIADDGSGAVDLSAYQYRLTDGQVAPWMATGSGPGLVKQATVKVKFTYTENASDGSSSVSSKTVPYHEKSAKITLTNLPGGTYQQYAAGEVIPYGLAGYIYNIEQIPQYEGTFTLQETEITDQCPMGNNLNLTGGRTEWTTMNACIQSISYDLTKGATTLTFGPAGHLGAKDFVERLRVNRGPRWFYQIGGNLINGGTGQQLGSNTSKHGPSPANAVTSVNVQPTSVSDWLTNSSSYTVGVPGTTIDSRSSGQPNYGGVGTPNAPVIHLATGSGGTTGNFARLNGGGDLIIKYIDSEDSTKDVTIQLKLSDIPDDFPASGISGILKFHEFGICNSDGSTSYVQVLSSSKYGTALGNTP